MHRLLKALVALLVISVSPSASHDPKKQPRHTPCKVGLWCVADKKAPKKELRGALDWACGPGGVDCSAIQPGGSCFRPNKLHNHASYAFNQYYQKHPIPSRCDFGGLAVTTDGDPSTPTCCYPSSCSSAPPAAKHRHPSSPPPMETPSPPSEEPASAVPPSADPKKSAATKFRSLSYFSMLTCLAYVVGQVL